MTGPGIQFVPFPAHAQAPEVGPHARQIQELWFSLARLRWSSLVIIPAEEGISGEAIARSLADVGSRLRDAPVTAILASSMDYDSARFLADLELRVRDHRGGADVPQGSTVDAEFRRPAPGRSGAEAPREVPAPDFGPAGPERGGDGEGGASLPPVGQIVVAIQPVTVEPLGVAIAHAADAVLVCVKLGETRMKSVRRTLELVGPARSVSALIVR
jgi:hypothetical protein